MGRNNTRKRSARELDNAIVQLLGKHEKKKKNEMNKPSNEDDALKMYFMACYGTVKKMKRHNQLKVKKVLNAILQEVEEEECLLDNDFM